MDEIYERLRAASDDIATRLYDALGKPRASQLIVDALAAIEARDARIAELERRLETGGTALMKASRQFDAYEATIAEQAARIKELER